MSDDFLGIYGSNSENNHTFSYGLFYSGDLYENFTYLNGNLDKYIQNKQYCFYQFPALVRLLSLKSEIITNDLGKKLYQTWQQNVAFIIDWTPDNYSYLIFKIYDENSLEQLSQNYNEIKNKAKKYLEENCL
jgi:hypothetical protein